jgi:hypothetical protein
MTVITALPMELNTTREVIDTLAPVERVAGSRASRRRPGGSSNVRVRRARMM